MSKQTFESNIQHYNSLYIQLHQKWERLVKKFVSEQLKEDERYTTLSMTDQQMVLMTIMMRMMGMESEFTFQEMSFQEMSFQEMSDTKPRDSRKSGVSSDSDDETTMVVPTAMVASAAASVAMASSVAMAKQNVRNEAPLETRADKKRAERGDVSDIPPSTPVKTQSEKKVPPPAPVKAPTRAISLKTTCQSRQPEKKKVEPESDSESSSDDDSKSEDSNSNSSESGDSESGGSESGSESSESESE